MMPVRCALAGHAWRFVAADRGGQIRWITWLCRHCPAKIETAESWAKPARGGILTVADVALIAMLAIVAAVVAILRAVA